MARVRVRIGRELVYFALGAMESFVITPLLAAVLSLIMPVHLLQITGVCLGAILAVHYLARALLRSSMHSALRSGLLGLGMLVSGLLVYFLVSLPLPIPPLLTAVGALLLGGAVTIPLIWPELKLLLKL